MKTVMYSFLGTQLDGGFQEKRWNRWRPNVGIAASTDPEINTLVLLYNEKHKKLAEQVAQDAVTAANRMSFSVRLKQVEMDPYDLPSTYLMMIKLREEETFQPDTRYLFNLSTGTHIIQVAIYKMIESRRWPGLLAQCGPGGGIKSNITEIDLDLRAYDSIMDRYRLEDLKGEDRLKQGIPTLNKAFNTMVTKLQRVASKSESPILLMGPTGAGKTAMARRLHSVKQQFGLLKGEFVEVNCATLRGDTVMSTLFGHKKGAFTGASDNREGLLKKAHQGLLFLDELGEMGLDEQAMLLHAIEDKTFNPVGSDTTVQSDFQLIAGTNRDLNEAVREGTFRADLLARINTWAFTMPGLRDRLEDIEPNLGYELAKLEHEHGTRYRFLAPARQAYLAFAASNEALWTGNFRDLAASIERMTTLCDNGVIDIALVEDEIETLRACWPAGALAGSGSVNTVDLVEKLLPGKEMNLLERAQLNAVLALCAEAKSYAALGRQIFGESVGKNPSQRVRDLLVDNGLTLEQVKVILAMDSVGR